jgi:hypothetical protein
MSSAQHHHLGTQQYNEPEQKANSVGVTFKLGEISGSHRDKYEDGCLLRCCTTVWWKVTDVSQMLTASIIGVTIEAASTFGTLVSVYQTMWHIIPEHSQLLKRFQFAGSLYQKHSVYNLA